MFHFLSHWVYLTLDWGYEEMFWKMASNLFNYIFVMPIYHNLGKIRRLKFHTLHYTRRTKLENHLFFGWGDHTHPYMLDSNPLCLPFAPLAPCDLANILLYVCFSLHDFMTNAYVIRKHDLGFSDQKLLYDKFIFASSYETIHTIVATIIYNLF